MLKWVMPPGRITRLSEFAGSCGTIRIVSYATSMVGAEPCIGRSRRSWRENVRPFQTNRNQIPMSAGERTPSGGSVAHETPQSR
jgi:hypothetical protein